MKAKPDFSNPIHALIQIAADLRDPDGGCPWDLKQSHASMEKHLIEESYEAAEIMTFVDEADDAAYAELKEELGDILFQVVFHAQMASEKNKFSFEDIALFASEKLVFRHPHVYGELAHVNTSEAVLKNWELLKRREKEDKKIRQNSPRKESMLAGLPKSMPALLKSFRMGQKVARVNFDWPSGKEGREQLFAKIQEEISELRDEIPQEYNSITEELNERQKNHMEEELGDLLFSICQLSRHLQLDPEAALQKANAKFKERFTFMENCFETRLDQHDHPSISEWNEAWIQAKKQNSFS